MIICPSYLWSSVNFASDITHRQGGRNHGDYYVRTNIAMLSTVSILMVLSMEFIGSIVV